MKESMGIDHVTLCVENLAACEYLFTKILGFEVIWAAQDVGSDKSSMDTVVVQRGEAKIALMHGRDKIVKSQINEFIEKYGQGIQHVAIEVDDIEAVCREWESHGPLKQRFTYPLFTGGGMFLELTQRQHGNEQAKTFVRGTVEALYKDIERDQITGMEQTIIDYEALPVRDDAATPTRRAS